MLSKYQREEDSNFKEKFKMLNDVQENRAKIKETINIVKNNSINFDEPYEIRTKYSRSVIATSN
jgi:hypothetical protein